jgi:hypothetical protein
VDAGIDDLKFEIDDPLMIEKSAIDDFWLRTFERLPAIRRVARHVL